MGVPPPPRACGLVLSLVSRCLEPPMKHSHSFLIYYIKTLLTPCVQVCYSCRQKSLRRRHGVVISDARLVLAIRDHVHKHKESDKISSVLLKKNHCNFYHSSPQLYSYIAIDLKFIVLEDLDVQIDCLMYI